MQLIKSAWAGKTCSYIVLGSRKNTVTSWILFLSGTFLAASTYKHSWIYTLDKLGFNNYLLVNCLLTLSTLHTTICDLSSEKNGKWSKEHKLCQGCRCSRPVLFHTHAHAAYFLQMSWTRTQKCWQPVSTRIPICDPLDKMSSWNVLTLSASSMVKPVLEKGGWLQSDFWC